VYAENRDLRPVVTVDVTDVVTVDDTVDEAEDVADEVTEEDADVVALVVPVDDADVVAVDDTEDDAVDVAVVDGDVTSQFNKRPFLKAWMASANVATSDLHAASESKWI